MTFRERRERRAERLREWSDKRRRRADASFTAARRALDGIEPGQPILVGHHSERRHRAALDRHDSAMRRGFESQDLASSMSGRAATIESQLETSIYNDDDNAIDALRAKLAGLEAQRERIKVVNKAVRRDGLAAAILTDAELLELATLDRVCPYHNAGTRGFPAYTLSNLGGQISRVRKRLEYLNGTPAAPAATTDSADPIARAGLEVHATMTTPSRPGKQPRPVWNVRGAIGAHRQTLIRLGGSFYRGAFSFWDDPTAALTEALS